MRTILRTIVLTAVICFSVDSQTKSYIFIFLNPNPNHHELTKADEDTLQARHIRNIRLLADEGKLLAAGPFEGGGGIFVFNTTVSDSVDEWLRTDPAFRAGRWTSEFYPYTPRIGSVCPVTGKVRMTKYKLFSYRASSFDNLEQNRRLFEAHEQFLKKSVVADSIVAEGSLGDGIGELLIVRNGANTKKLLRDAAVRNKSLILEVRELWIARGSFGEK